MRIGGDGQNAVQLLLLITAVSLAPALLFTVTGFTRILIVLGFIRTGLGTPTAPPNQVLVGIALFLTIFVMAPTFSQIKKDAIDPLQKNQITEVEALKRGEGPLREFMFKQTRTKDLALFVSLAKMPRPKTREDIFSLSSPRMMPWLNKRTIGSSKLTRPRSRMTLVQKRVYSRCITACSMPPIY